MRECHCVEALVFLAVFGSAAFFWHSRDWNTASRLILTYALVDDRTVCLDGLDRQTGDIAFFQGHYYCDKLPGFSMLGTVPYIISRWILCFPPHPRNETALQYWPPDYWITLGTSGLFTALTAVLLVRLARDLGCSSRRAALVGLAYGLGTPAYVYATLAYGHQLTSFALLASYELIRKRGPGRAGGRFFASGFLAAYAAVVELQVGPVSAILGLTLLAQCLFGQRRPDALAYFGLGALIPTLMLLGYNVLAFGSPWEMGYFHHATAIFARVHNRENPLGLQRPDFQLIRRLLWGEYRGLLFYAPIFFLSVPGWFVLFARPRRGLGVTSLAVCLTVLLINLSYPEWTGGWCTGPRLLVPLFPFAMIPIAALLAENGRWSRPIGWTAAGLALGGGIIILMFQGVGSRLPQDIHAPFREIVWPFWTSNMPTPTWWPGPRFARNLVSLGTGDWLVNRPVRLQVLQFLPLVCFQLAVILALTFCPRLDLRVDEQQKRRGSDENPQDPKTQPHSMHPDERPGLVAGGRVNQADGDHERQNEPVDAGRRDATHADPPAFTPSGEASDTWGEVFSAPSSVSGRAGPSKAS
jgi:hypothetical protein